MGHVFISFSKEDREFAEELDKRIRADAGLDTWFFIEGIRAGDQWKQEIDRAIEECHVMVVVKTPAAMESMYVTYEWAYAMGWEKPVVPILLEEAEPHPKLGDIQHRDFTTDPHPWDRFIEDLKAAVESQAERERTIMVPRDAPRAVKQAAKELDSPDPGMCSKAIGRLADIGIERPVACKVLIGELGHVSHYVRVEIAKTLAELFAGEEIESAVLDELRGTAAVAAALKEALGDSNWKVRVAAVVVLGKIGDAGSVPGLLEVLRDKDPGVRRATAQALGKIGDAAAVPGLVEALDDEDIRVRRFTAHALGEIGDSRAVEGLVGALDDIDAGVRREAAQALGEIGDASAVPGLLEALHDKDPGVRRATAQALGKLGDARAVDGLVGTLDDNDIDVRQDAARSLGIIGDARAVPGLEKALRDTNINMRRAAAEALERIGTAEALEALARWRARR